MKKRIVIVAIFFVAFSFIFPFSFLLAKPSDENINELAKVLEKTNEILETHNSKNYKYENSIENVAIDELFLPKESYEIINTTKKDVVLAKAYLDSEKNSEVLDEDVIKLKEKLLLFNNNIYPEIIKEATNGVINFKKDFEKEIQIIEAKLEDELIVVSENYEMVSRAKHYLSQINYNKLLQLVDDSRKSLDNNELNQRDYENKLLEFEANIKVLELKKGSKNHMNDFNDQIESSKNMLKNIIISENGQELFSDISWITKSQKESFENIIKEYENKLNDLKKEEDSIQDEIKKNSLDFSYLKYMNELKKEEYEFISNVVSFGKKDSIIRKELKEKLLEIENEVNKVNIIDNNTNLKEYSSETLFISKEEKDKMADIILTTKKLLENNYAKKDELKEAKISLDNAYYGNSSYDGFCKHLQKGKKTKSLVSKNANLIISITVVVVIILMVIPWIPLIIKKAKQEKLLKEAKKEKTLKENNIKREE